MQSNAKAKDAEVNERSIEDLLSALVYVRDVPLVGKLVVAQRPTEYILCYAIFYHDEAGEEGVHRHRQQGHFPIARVHHY